MNAKPLTRQQQNVLTFVTSFQQERGYPPTLREIGTAIGLANINAVRGHLEALVKKGYVTRTPDKARSIQVVRAPSRMRRIKRKLHRVLRTDEYVLHRIIYGLAWATQHRDSCLIGPAAHRLRRAFDREAAEQGWTNLELRIEPDHVVVVVETWPNHSAQRAVQRLQAAGNTIKRHVPGHSSRKALWDKGYVATTDLKLLDGLVDQFLNAGDEPNNRVVQAGRPARDAARS
jgi:SOS-response transcriptional repressor LexA